jgi:hypothetical protein
MGGCQGWRVHFSLPQEQGLGHPTVRGLEDSPETDLDHPGGHPPQGEVAGKIKAGVSGFGVGLRAQLDSMASPVCLKEVEQAAASYTRLTSVVAGW